MGMENDDRRVRKTKRALRNGLTELMVDKNLRNITVRELTDKVDIHRATFYAHYMDIYDLYEQMENAVVEELNDIIMQNYSKPPIKFYTILFEYIIENKQLCRMLFGTKGEGRFLIRLNSLFEEKCIVTWCKEWGISEVSEELKYNVRYHVQGCLAIISRWVESDFTHPMDVLVKILADIDRSMESYVMKKQKA
ncbi:TetR/AcrR family transcriptional regulator [Caldalkalibacillus mannanilyticus]|uniref:TetR/AcrR family transcriptional regulator n=1 Tax=Caldalkalibacillus mannanilyticus TaxID=1418 RepID=UPI0006843906|nr:TetR-like C-terminal domain-containing protein [Caldalkalibacillus mannanilyticus]